MSDLSFELPQQTVLRFLSYSTWIECALAPIIADLLYRGWRSGQSDYPPRGKLSGSEP